MWVIFSGSIVLLTFAIAYIAVILSSHRKVIEAQKSKLVEVTRSAERYKALFDHSLAGMMKFSVDTLKIHEGNAALQAMFGCTTDEEIQQYWRELLGSKLADIKAILEKTGIISEYEIHAKRSNGNDLWLLLSAKVAEGDQMAHGVLVDITNWKSAETKVKEQAALLNETLDAIIVTEKNGEITFWNRGAELMYGWSAGEAAGHPIQKQLYSHNRENQYADAMEHLFQFNEWNGEHHHVKRDGREILVEGKWRVIQHSAKDRKTLFFVNTDITNKKKMEAKFIEAQRMESIALLTGGIAHDLQNILAPVSMSIGLLRNELKSQTSLNVLRAVEESAQSGLQLIKNILTYGKGVIGARENLDIVSVLNHVLEIVERGLPSSITLDRIFPKRDLTVHGDMNQLTQAFLNICVNGRDAMAQGGTLTIRIERRSINEDELENYPYAQAGCFVVVSITDTGIGIPPEQIEMIFEPFYTTKTGGEGTGLGLSIALGIVKSHGGFMTVDSAVNRGTTFHVHIPSIGNVEL
jgi:PAS domain S-box-containing protein